jgi:NhaP-type Na+/H+ or K+/H+ antiporter
MPDLLTAFALVGIVLVVSALTSSLVERAPLSFPIVFLGLGFLLGERGLGFIAVGPHDATLESVAIVSLAFVLFLDAVRLRSEDIGADWLVPVLVLGPGTLLTVGLIALGAWLLLPVHPLQAILLGAILSSTDPVVLRDVVRDARLPRSIRQTLSLEAGTNDLIVLPIVLVAIVTARAQAGTEVEWGDFLLGLFVLGPLAGVAVGGVGAWLVAEVDRRIGVRREYQSLYGVGLVLGAYAAGTAVGGDGFLAAFAAGIAIVVLNYRLCDCFIDYGDVTVEILMLLAFVLFGAALSTMLARAPLGPTLGLAALALGIARPAAITLVLARASLSRSARAFIGWFGPRGLNSLLLALLAVRAGVPEAEWLLAVAGLVVIVSVVAHGVSATPLAAWYARRVEHETLAEERESTAVGLLRETRDEAPRVTPAQLAERLAGPAPPLVVDVRSRSDHAADPEGIPGSVRVTMDELAAWASGQVAGRPIVTYCGCPHEGSSARAAQQLRALGLDAGALAGGLDAWRASYPSPRQASGSGAR